MKMKRTKLANEQDEAHTLPLLALALLCSLHPLTGRGRQVFSGERSYDRPISDNLVPRALHALGLGREETGHGFQAMANTILVDHLNPDPLAVEANLAHAVKAVSG